MFLNLIYLILIIAPISLIVHELGHAFAAYFLKADKIIVTLGIGKKLKTFKVKNINIIIHLCLMLNAYTCSERHNKFTKKEFSIITIMGPVMSLFMSIFFYYAYAILETEFIFYFFLFNIWLTISNLIPFKIGQRQSDGYVFLKLLK